MKPQIGIILIVFIFLGVFIIYSNLPNRTGDQIVTGEELRANINVVLGDAITNQGPERSESEKTPANVNIESMNGLNEELQGIVDGSSVIIDELQLLKKAPIEPAQ